MKVLLGKPKIEFTASPAAQNATWTEIDTPREGTTTLNTTDGTALEAKEEGGVVVEHIDTADSYSLEFECFKKNGVALPFTDVDGVINGEFAFRVTSAVDTVAPSFQIDRARVSASVQYSVNDTLRVKYTVTPLKPETGSTIKILDNTSTNNG